MSSRLRAPEPSSHSSKGLAFVNPLPSELSDLIPTDIHEYIISFLSHAPTALKNCSLTCRAWLWSSWKTLFKHCIVRVHGSNIDSFLELIDRNTRTITIIRFIQLLHIEQGGSKRLFSLPTADSRLPEAGDYEVFQFDDFLHRLVGLTSVRNLKLGWVRSDTSTPTSIALKNNFAGVTALDLDSVILSSPEHFFEILGAFPQLSSLSLTGVLFNGEHLYDGLDSLEELDARRTDLSVTPPPPHNLCELYANVTEDVTEFLYTWFTHHDAILPLRSISVGLFTESSNSALSKFLDHSGLALEEIMIRDAHSASSFDLSYCVALRALEIGCIYLQSSNTEPSAAGSITFVTDVLQTITSHHVEYVKIVLAISDYEDVEAQINVFDWQGLSDVLERPQFQRLNRMRFVVSGHQEAVHQAIVQHLTPQFDLGVFDVIAWSHLVSFFPFMTYSNLI